jgi:hypothetical protein
MPGGSRVVAFNGLRFSHLKRIAASARDVAPT